MSVQASNHETSPFEGRRGHTINEDSIKSLPPVIGNRALHAANDIQSTEPQTQHAALDNMGTLAVQTTESDAEPTYTPLGRTQVTWLQKIYSGEQVERILALSDQQRSSFANQLATAYRNITFYRAPQDLDEQADRLADFISGKTYEEIVGSDKNDNKKLRQTLARITKHIQTGVEEAELVELVPEPLPGVEGKVVSLDDYRSKQENDQSKRSRKRNPEIQDLSNARQELLDEIDGKKKRREADKELSRMVEGTSDRAALSRMTNHRLLTPLEELSLAKRIERGDLDAKNTMTEHNLRLVLDIAWEYYSEAMSLSDRFDEGVFGLIRAVEKYDYRRGLRFSTYAVIWIRQAVQRAVHNKELMIRLPHHMHTKANAIRNFEEEWQQNHDGVLPSDELIAENTDVTMEEINLIRQTQAKVASLEKPVGEDPNGATLGSQIASREPSVEDQVIALDRKSQLKDLIDQLPERQAKAVRLYYGVDEETDLPMRAVAQRMGVSTSAVQQMLKKANNKLEELAAANTDHSSDD